MDKPDAVVAVSALPVKLPTKLVAVITPEELTCLDATSFTVTFGVPVKPSARAAVPVVFWFNVATLAAATVPELILLPFNALILEPFPTKLVAVIIPLDCILPFTPSIPTPSLPTVLGSDPICIVNLGSVVPTPTLPEL